MDFGPHCIPCQVDVIGMQRRNARMAGSHEVARGHALVRVSGRLIDQVHPHLFIHLFMQRIGAMLDA